MARCLNVTLTHSNKHPHDTAQEGYLSPIIYLSAIVKAGLTRLSGRFS